MYRTVSGSFWTDPKVRGLAADEKLLFLYLITNPHTHMSGIYALDLRYASTDLGLPMSKIAMTLKKLCALRICEYDLLNQIIWVRRMMSYQGRGEKNLRSAAYHLTEDLHNSYLCEGFLAEYPDVQRFLGPRFKRPSRDSIPASMRFEVLERDGNRCVKCGAGPEETTLEADHIIPHSAGGRTTMDNLQALCQNCNIGKSDRVSVVENGVSEFGTPDSPFPIPDPNPEQKPEQKPEILTFGEFASVRLSEVEHGKLKARLDGNLDNFIAQLDRYSQTSPSKFRKYKSHYAVILDWFDRAQRDGKVNGTAHRMPTEAEIEAAGARHRANMAPRRNA